MRVIRTKRYLKDIKRIGLTAKEAVALELEITANPTAGNIIQGLGGIRKIRFALGKRGKSGGGRAIYFLMLADDAVALLFAYAKNEQSDLTGEQRKAALAMMKEIIDG